MRITTITNWAYGITVVLTALSGASFIMSSRSALQERSAVEEHLVLDTLAEELALGAEVMSDEARLYVMRGEERHLQAFQAEEGKERRREEAATKLAAQALFPAEVAALTEIVRDAEALDKIEASAIERFQRGDKTAAQDILFGAEHERVQNALLQTVDHFRDLTATRAASELEAARARSNWWTRVAEVMLAVTGALFVAVLYFVLRRRVAMPLLRMAGAVNRLAKQDYTVEVPIDRRGDEIGEMNEAIEIFRTNLIERERLDAERRTDQHRKDLILQMMHRVQACQNQEEMTDVVVRFAPQIFPGLAGGLYILKEGNMSLMRVGAWLDPKQSAVYFPAAECWGMRRGRSHHSGVNGADVPCQHLDHLEATLCVPLTAQGDMIGLLYLEEQGEEILGLTGPRLYLELIAENVGLAIANLQLREKLTTLAVHDPLTGLFNRRFLDERLQQHVREESGQPLVCLMIDIDYFKRFNDQFGHDAGDLVMRFVGQTLRETCSSVGSAFRFGGEEFTVLLPSLDEGDGVALADTLREKISSAALSHAGQLLGAISVSVGVAAFPTGGSVETLITRADAALLEAKAKGRDRTIAASGIKSSRNSVSPSSRKP
ncbi:diguanylate cyclase [Shinella kummerowiae]|jgi:diguanylate cyclase (GGDEF)-like protein|uniref:diguanylate cyclase n=1 Tax=Shinella kummerowiae TaxID=417745 RepID=A0A6N8SCT9_9HYPH|nr:diguanylate cyclase [Shinella kummerowiae]MXN46413.1 diguanylate cyclase [Shinella kummerowiae]